MKNGIIGITALALAATLGPRGAVAQCCGDCNGDNEVTIEEIIAAVNRTLEGCQDDRICSLESCAAQFAQCQTDLAACRAYPGGQRLPASGQTTSYGPGSDGEVRAGAALSYTDNGDGTITDNNTGLMWEKKDQSGGIHDVDNRYTWGMDALRDTMNGTMVTGFLATLNRVPCFAGHCDWRIPNVRELQSLVDYEDPYPGPTVNAAFHRNCGAGCTVNGNGGPVCSCTASGFYASYYWSSTTNRHSPPYAWVVVFDNGDVFVDLKSHSDSVRAVRGGS